MLGTILFLFFPFLMIMASVQDFLSMTISNKVSLALMAGFVVFSLAYGMDWHTMMMHWAAFAVALAITFGLFAINVMGGGDAKLIPTTILWLGWSASSVEYVLYSSLLGGALTLVILSVRSMPMPQAVLNMPGVAKIHSAGSGIPYGIALGPGGLIAYLNSDWAMRILGLG